jgi:hypothetical protein
MKQDMENETIILMSYLPEHLHQLSQFYHFPSEDSLFKRVMGRDPKVS